MDFSLGCGVGDVNDTENIVANPVVALCSFAQRAAKRMAARAVQEGSTTTMADNGIVDNGKPPTAI